MSVALINPGETKNKSSYCRCSTCNEFYRRGASHLRPQEIMTLGQAQANVEQNIRQVNKWGPRAVDLRDANAPASIESKHAHCWLIRFKAEKRHWEEYAKHYREMLKAHPEWEARDVRECELDWAKPARPEPIPNPPDPRLPPETDDECPF
jgi:hypothetical protein